MKVFAPIKKYIWRNRWYYLAGLIALVVVDGLQLIIPRLLKRAVDALTLGTATNSMLLKIAGIIALIAVGIGLMRFLWRYLIIGVSWRIDRDLRNRYFAHLMRIHPGWYDKAVLGDLMARATNDLSAVRMFWGIGIVASADSLIFMIATVVMMILIDFKLMLYALIPLPILTIIVVRVGRIVHRRSRVVQEVFASLMEKAREIYAGIRVVKAYTQEDAEDRNFGELNQTYLKKNMHLMLVWGLFEPFLSVVIGFAYGIVLILGGTSVILGGMSMGDFVAFNSYLGFLIWPMIAMGWIINLYQRGTASMKRINEILSQEPLIVDGEGARDADIEGNIKFDGLSFGYEKDNLVLHNISLDIAAGETVAIVGRTGSGKSTVVRLLPRLYDPPGATLEIDNRDIHKIKLLSLRSQIGMVPQESFLFSDTIAENIRFGKPDASSEEIERCARIAHIYDEIVAFPDGFESEVGERGVSLSGGQKQRIAIARALLVNPKILILDDALSAVDTETEEQILSELKKLFKDRTVIIISHRISTVKDADKIYVIDDGRIVEQGKHDELIEQNGIYAEINRLQELEEELR